MLIKTTQNNLYSADEKAQEGKGASWPESHSWNIEKGERASSIYTSIMTLKSFMDASSIGYSMLVPTQSSLMPLTAWVPLEPHSASAPR